MSNKSLQRPGSAEVPARVRAHLRACAALRACLEAGEDVHDRNPYFALARLSAADAMRTELLNDDLGRAAGILNDEKRTIGWNGFYGAGSDAAHQSFWRYADAVQAARLADKPDAGFSH